MSERVKHAMHYCEKFGQSHLLKYLKPIFTQEADDFAKQILQIDFQQINKLFESIKKDKNEIENSFELSPAITTKLENLSNEQRQELTSIGLNAIKNNEVCAITMAGGEGTRLGHSGPKGTFILDINPPKSLFEIQANKLYDLYNETGNFIPWLIMTSESNYDHTKKYFEENNYFGYEKGKITIFKQEMLPAVDFQGKILVRNKKIIMSPNGNGGVFSSLIKSGNYDKLKSMGIKRVFICGIDNPLVKMCDPIFIGFSIKKDSQIACKSVLKRSWDEKAGVFVRKNDKPGYVEYTEISQDQAKSTDDNNNLLFADVGIVMYVYHIDVIEDLSKNELPFHEANKKIPFTDDDGKNITPKKPNGIKFETFIFDSFDYVNDVSILRVERNEEFAPIKNSTGEDSPEVAIKLMKQLK